MKKILLKNEAQLFKIIEDIHFKCHKLCKQTYGDFLPVAGNIGVFCHDEEEYERLVKIRKELTNLEDNWNQKYFRLYKPIVILAKNGIPKTTYTYLYIRKPEKLNNHIGDVDFYLEPSKYKKLKKSILSGKVIKGVEVFNRPDLNLIRLYDLSYDVSAFIGQKNMEENVREKE